MTSPVISFIFLVFLVALVRAESVDDQLQSMSSAELAKLEKTLRMEVEQHDKDLVVMREDTDRLKTEQSQIDQEAERLQGAKEWEQKEKEKREEELKQAKNDVQLKQDSISRMSTQVSELRSQISELEMRLKRLSDDKYSTEKKYDNPSIADVLESRSQGWGNVSRNVFNKTMTDVVPAFNKLKENAQSYRRQVSSSSKVLEIVASVFIYSFVIVAAIATYRIYNKVRGKLTVSRLLFLGDAFCASFWALMLVCFMILFNDPLLIMKQSAPVPFFVFQLVACFSYVNFVLLRVLVLASKMTLGSLGETLAVVVVGHHYYVRVWQPAILDEPFRGTFFYYFCYAWLFSAFAFNRIQEFAPLKQLRGKELPTRTWLRVLFARFTNRSIPDGDIESDIEGTPFIESDDEDHES